jgi:DNA-binding transcriptional LysR family regulator
MHSYRLQVLHAVARYRSYSRAAREALHISQPAVSKHVQALEAELGVPLVQRVGKRVDLTDAGRLVQQYADQVLALAEETQRALLDLQGVQRGTLRLAASSTPGFYLLLPVLAAFTQAYPGITLAVEIANSGRVVAGMLNQAWDLGVVSGTPDEAQLQVQPYCRDTLILIVPPSHRLAAQPAVTLADLVGWRSTRRSGRSTHRASRSGTWTGSSRCVARPSSAIYTPPRSPSAPSRGVSVPSTPTWPICKRAGMPAATLACNSGVKCRP